MPTVPSRELDHRDLFEREIRADERRRMGQIVEALAAPLIAAFEDAAYHEIEMSGVCGQSVMEDVEVVVYALRVALGLEVPSRIVGGQDPVTRV